MTIAVTIESILLVYILRNNRSKKKSTYILAKTWRARWLKNAPSNKKIFLQLYFLKELCLAVIMWWKFKFHYPKCNLITSLTFKAYFYLKFLFLISKHKFLSKVQFQFCVELLSKINYGNFLSALAVSDLQARVSMAEANFRSKMGNCIFHTFLPVFQKILRRIAHFLR